MASILSIDGVELHNQNTDVFREFAVRLPGSAAEALTSMDKSGVLGASILGNGGNQCQTPYLSGATREQLRTDINALTNALRDWVMEVTS